MYKDLFGTKVTRALAASQGERHLRMIAQKAQPFPGAPKQVPDFIANYPPIYPSEPSAAPRLVGHVRAFQAWNTGMRSSHSTDHRVSYLRELAMLQGAMRAHHCRYGFILTEIELVCVRMGAEEGKPYFGLLELSDPIRLSVHSGSAESGSEDSGSSTSSSNNGSGRQFLTVGIALWYLHMLAKDQPLPGQPGWKVDVGPPAACTRQHVKDKDPGLIGEMKPEGREKRDAKRNRGWVDPREPVSRKETGKPKRWTKKMERERLERLDMEDRERELLEARGLHFAASHGQEAAW